MEAKKLIQKYVLSMKERKLKLSARFVKHLTALLVSANTLTIMIGKLISVKKILILIVNSQSNLSIQSKNLMRIRLQSSKNNLKLKLLMLIQKYLS